MTRIRFGLILACAGAAISLLAAGYGTGTASAARPPGATSRIPPVAQTRIAISDARRATATPTSTPTDTPTTTATAPPGATPVATSTPTATPTVTVTPTPSPTATRGVLADVSFEANDLPGGQREPGWYAYKGSAFWWEARNGLLRIMNVAGTATDHVRYYRAMKLSPVIGWTLEERFFIAGTSTGYRSNIVEDGVHRYRIVAYATGFLVYHGNQVDENLLGLFPMELGDRWTTVRVLGQGDTLSLYVDGSLVGRVDSPTTDTSTGNVFDYLRGNVDVTVDYLRVWSTGAFAP